MRNFYKNGFTLIELLIVFSILAVLFMLGTASFRTFSQSQELDQAAANLANLLNTAKLKAQAQVKPSDCPADSTLRDYRVTSHQIQEWTWYPSPGHYVASGDPGYLYLFAQCERIVSGFPNDPELINSGPISTIKLPRSCFTSSSGYPLTAHTSRISFIVLSGEVEVFTFTPVGYPGLWEYKDNGDIQIVCQGNMPEPKNRRVSVDRLGNVTITKYQTSYE